MKKEGFEFVDNKVLLRSFVVRMLLSYHVAVVLFDLLVRVRILKDNEIITNKFLQFLSLSCKKKLDKI